MTNTKGTFKAKQNWYKDICRGERNLKLKIAAICLISALFTILVLASDKPWYAKFMALSLPFVVSSLYYTGFDVFGFSGKDWWKK